MGQRRKAREDALKVLFQMDVAPRQGDPLEHLDLYWESQDEEVEADRRAYAERIVCGVRRGADEIDDLISSHALNWRLERLAAVDRNLLRLGIYELLHEPEVPRAVVINEALEMAKRYSTDESSQFINGVLDAVRRSLEPETDEPREAGAAGPLARLRLVTDRNHPGLKVRVDAF